MASNKGPSRTLIGSEPVAGSSTHLIPIITVTPAYREHISSARKDRLCSYENPLDIIRMNEQAHEVNRLLPNELIELGLELKKPAITSAGILYAKKLKHFVQPDRLMQFAKTSNTLLEWGLLLGSCAMVSSAIQQGASWHVPLSVGTMACMYAAEKSSHEVKKYFLTHHIMPIVSDLEHLDDEALNEYLRKSIRNHQPYRAILALHMGANPSYVNSRGYSIMYFGLKYMIALVPSLLIYQPTLCIHAKKLRIKLLTDIMASSEPSGYLGFVPDLMNEYVSAGLERRLKSSSQAQPDYAVFQGVSHVLSSLINRQSVLTKRSITDIHKGLELSFNQVNDDRHYLSDSVFMVQCDLEKHLVYLVFDLVNQKMAICNRGKRFGNEARGVTIVPLEKCSAQTIQVVEDMIDALSSYDELKKQLKHLLNINFDALPEGKKVLAMSPQTWGNCAWSSVQAAIKACLYFHTYDEQKTQTYYESWNNTMKALPDDMRHDIKVDEATQVLSKIRCF